MHYIQYLRQVTYSFLASCTISPFSHSFSTQYWRVFIFNLEWENKGTIARWKIHVFRTKNLFYCYNSWFVSTCNIIPAKLDNNPGIVIFIRISPWLNKTTEIKYRENYINYFLLNIRGAKLCEISVFLSVLRELRSPPYKKVEKYIKKFRWLK